MKRTRGGQLDGRIAASPDLTNLIATNISDSSDKAESAVRAPWCYGQVKPKFT